jgi:peptide deformylase
MSRLKVVCHPDPLLREKSMRVDDIDDAVAELASDMVDAMHRARGIGLAGVQVGRLERLFVVHVDGDIPRVFINPSILETSLEQGGHDEGCLSIPEIYADVTRPLAVRVQAWNERGRPFTLDAEGMLARVVQHEYDHLNGVLFIDHLSEEVREKVLADYDRVLKPSLRRR